MILSIHNEALDRSFILELEKDIATRNQAIITIFSQLNRVMSEVDEEGITGDFPKILNICIQSYIMVRKLYGY